MADPKPLYEILGAGGDYERWTIVALVLAAVAAVVAWFLLTSNGNGRASDGGGGGAADQAAVAHETAPPRLHTTLPILTSHDDLADLGDGVVMVKVDWCGYCRQALPEFEAAAAKAVGAALAVVDADASPDLAKSLGASSYPTIVGVKKGKAHDVYSGSRSSDALAEFARTVVPP